LKKIKVFLSSFVRGVVDYSLKVGCPWWQPSRRKTSIYSLPWYTTDIHPTHLCRYLR